MVLVLPRHRIAIFPIRKVATTTINDAIIAAFSGPGELRRTQTLPMSPWQRWQARGCYRIAVVRDPVRRFLSAYGNRVVHHRDLTDQWTHRVMLRLLGLEPLPDIDAFLARLRAYRLANDSVRRHTDLQRRALGGDLSYFHAIYPISELPAFAADIERRTGRRLELKRLQTGGPKLAFSDLAPRSRRILLDYLAPDYALLSRFFSPPSA